MPFGFLAFNTKLPIMAMLTLKDFATAKRLPPVELDPMIIRVMLKEFSSENNP